MNIQINFPKQNQRIFLPMNIFVQTIQIYSNIRIFAKYCIKLFWKFLYFVAFGTHIDPFWTNNNHFGPYLGSNEKSNIFSIIDIG